jgi:hypothetical protein
MKYLQSFALSLLSFFAPIQGLLIAAIVAIGLDTITGIIKAYKLGGWKAVRSRKASDIGGKILLYNLSIMSCYMIDKYLLHEFVALWFTIEFLFTKLITIVFVLIELKSIKENYEEAYKVDTWKLLMALLKRGKEVKNDINELTN